LHELSIDSELQTTANAEDELRDRYAQLEAMYRNEVEAKNVLNAEVQRLNTFVIQQNETLLNFKKQIMDKFCSPK
jgi:hypothetical protein